MTSDDVRDQIRAQIGDPLATVNDHGASLQDLLVLPQRIQVIARFVTQGEVRDELLDVWLIGQEKSSDGYRIVMREKDLMFGLASGGFPSDQHLVLAGWYGDLLSAFVNM